MAYYDGELVKENFAKRLNQVDGIMITVSDASVLLTLSMYDTRIADVAEVKHGKMMLDGRCSECLQSIILSSHNNFCPNCGADIRGERNEV